MKELNLGIDSILSAALKTIIPKVNPNYNNFIKEQIDSWSNVPLYSLDELKIAQDQTKALFYMTPLIVPLNERGEAQFIGVSIDVSADAFGLGVGTGRFKGTDFYEINIMTFHDTNMLRIYAMSDDNNTFFDALGYLSACSKKKKEVKIGGILLRNQETDFSEFLMQYIEMKDWNDKIEKAVLIPANGNKYAKLFQK